MLNLSYDDLINLYDIAIKRSRRLNDKFKRDRDTQIEIERNLLRQIQYKDEFDLLNHLNQINYVELYDLLAKNPQDVNLLKAMSYIISALVNSPDLTDYFNKIKKVGVESKYGEVIISELNGIFPVIIKTIKSIKDQGSIDSLVHEAIVSYEGTNKLRECGFLNFAYMYTHFYCGSISNDQLCFNNNEAQYIVYENILDIPTKTQSIPIYKFLETCTIEDFFLIYLPLIQVLVEANDLILFTHYDLHLGNILIRRLRNEPCYLHHNNGKYEYYTYSNGCIPVFIDFGLSFIVNDHNEPFGAVDNMESYGRFHDRSHILGDIYFLTLNILGTFQDRDLKLYNSLKYMLHFFHPLSDIDDIVSRSGIKDDIFQSSYIPYLPQTASNVHEWEQYAQSTIELPEHLRQEIATEFNALAYLNFVYGWARTEFNIRPIFSKNSPEGNYEIIGCDKECLPLELQTEQIINYIDIAKHNLV